MIWITVEQANEILHSMRWKLIKQDYTPSEIEQNTIEYLQGEVNKNLANVPVSGSLPFTDEQLLEMEDRPFPSKLWNEAFNFYNADKNNSRLSMGCRPCFNKVMVYLLKIRFRQ